MNVAILVLVVGALALLLTVSGIAKLSDRQRSQQALSDLRLPGSLSTQGFAVSWSVLEVTVAIGLVVLPGRWAVAAGVVATAMMVGHLVVVARAARFTEPVHCHCFGALDREPVTARTVVRTGGFLALTAIALTGLVTVTGSTGTAERSIATLALSLRGADLGLLQLGLLMAGAGAVVLLGRSVGQSRPEPSGAHHPGPLATERPVLGEHRLPDIFGASPDVRTFTGEQRSVLVLLSTSCAACRSLAEQLPALRNELSGLGIQLRVVTPLPAAEALGSFPLLGSFLHHDVDGLLAERLGVSTYPAAIAVGRDGPGSLDDGPAFGSHAVTVLIDNIRTGEEVRA